MVQSRTTLYCIQATGPSGTAGCAAPRRDGHETITVVDTSWGVPGLGTEGTLAVAGMALSAAVVSVVAWRALAPGRADTTAR